MTIFISAMTAARFLALSVFLLAAGVAAGAQDADPAKMALGKQVFTEIAQPQCSLCHTLADAGAVGEVGPILDQLKPNFDRVKIAVTNGIGPMQPNEILTDEQIEAVALYVSQAAGKTP